MFCEKCGAPLDQGENFCPVCGAPVGNTGRKDSDGLFDKSYINTSLNPTPVMVRSIVAVALSWLPVVGLILAIIARVKVNACYEDGGVMCGQSKTGSALSKLALALSIVMTVYWVMIIAAIAYGVTADSVLINMNTWLR